MSQLDLAAVTAAFERIAETNGWASLHTPKNLANATAVEAGELLALFQWLDDGREVDRAAVADECADVLMYLQALCASLDIDLAEAVERKAVVNAERWLINKQD